MSNFNEWLTKRHGDLDELTSDGNLGMATTEDVELVTNQLEMFVDRIAGVLHNVSEASRDKLIQKFIADVKARF